MPICEIRIKDIDAKAIPVFCYAVSRLTMMPTRARYVREYETELINEGVIGIAETFVSDELDAFKLLNNIRIRLPIIVYLSDLDFKFDDDQRPI